jgi:hypothetical protein
MSFFWNCDLRREVLCSREIHIVPWMDVEIETILYIAL